MGQGDGPPRLTSDTIYSQWKREVRIWQLGTTVNKSKQAAHVFSMLTGKVREHVSRLSLEVFGSETGLDRMLADLDVYYKKDEAQTLFMAVENLETYRRSKDESITDYIEEFSRRNDLVKEQIDNEDALHNGVLAYRLLKQASLTENEQRLVRATIGHKLLEALDISC